jgi:uncharacterized protein YjiS (DUF1127 family)
MSLTFEEGLAGSGRHFLTRIADGLLAAHDRQRRYFAIRRTRRKLHELPDWILRDIGINRGEIDGLSARVHEPYQDGGDRSWRFQL